MAWKKVPVENEDMLDRCVGAHPGVRKLKMFGCPVYAVNGNMFAGAHQEDIFLRLSEADHDEIYGLDGVRPFEPMPGRIMREYVVVPESVYRSESEFLAWVERSLHFAASLPPKERKKRQSA